jgi:hypothetical protein
VVDLGDQGQTVLTFWLSCETTKTSLPSQQIVFRDANDQPWKNSCFMMSSGARNVGVIAREWPRRSKILTLDIFTKYQNPYYPTQAASRIVVANPSYARHLQWTPDRLPATRRVGEMNFTLQGVNVEELRWMSNVDDYFRRATISTKITERGQPSADWEASSLALADATGNSTEHLENYYWKPGSKFNCWRWPAMPGEDAIKLRVEFVKTNGYTSNEIFVVRGVPMSPLPPWRFTTNLPVGRLVLRKSHNSIEVVPPGYDPANTNWSSRRFVLRSATDEQGFASGFMGVGVKAGVRRGTRTLDVTVAVPPVHWAEWIVPAGGTIMREIVSPMD